MYDLYGDLPVGIDLGTNNSCIGYWDGSQVRIVPNSIGEKITPSVIYLYNNQLYVGEGAYEDIKIFNVSDKIHSIKRILGLDYDDIEQGILENLHYNIIKDEKTKRPVVKLTTEEKSEYTPVELTSLILKKLVSNAKKCIPEEITKVVISVPANFNDAQRCATIDAAKLAGLEVIKLINEPTAAALSYGLGQEFYPIKKDLSCFSQIFRKNREIRMSQNGEINKINQSYNLKQSRASVGNDKGKNILVFDLGGGTFDLAILKINLENKEYEVKSKYSDKYLGGDDFDNAIADYCLKENGINKNEIDNRSKERLKKACEWAKKSLSKCNESENDEKDIQACVRLNNFTEKKEYLLFQFSKKDFEEKICKALFDKLGSYFDKLLEGANLAAEDIDEIILVGGSSRMPKIKDIIRKKFGEDCIINDEVNPEEVVTYGATIQAAMILKDKKLKNVKLYDITPFSLGTDVINDSEKQNIKDLGVKMSVIIPKWTKIPTFAKKEYETVINNQEMIRINIYEGENDYVKYNKLIGEFVLNNISRKPKGEVRIEISIKIDENNILTITAIEKSPNLSNNKLIREISNRKNLEGTWKSKGLSYKEFNELKKCNYKEIGEYLNLYKNSKDKEEKIQILEKYNKKITDKINNIYSGEELKDLEDPEKINIEKYFFNVYLLLESDEEILDLNSDEEKKNNILKEIKKYICIFKSQSIYYIKEIINLFKSAKREIFLEIFYFSIKTLNESASDYLKEKKNNCRYFSKLYYEEIVKLYNKYIKKSDVLIEIKKEIDEQKRESEEKLEIINSDAILLIYPSLQKKKLIDTNIAFKHKESLKDIKDNWYTGFTYKSELLNPNKENLNYEDYNIIYDKLENMYNVFEQLINDNNYDNKKKREFVEQKGICLGSMVKIKLKYQKETDYSKYKKLIEKCINYAEFCSKNNDECEWYKEVLELQKEIELQDEIMKESEKKINSLKEEYDIGERRFIDNVLSEIPYEGLNLDEYEFKDNKGNIVVDEIEFLIKKYDPVKYPRKTKDEKINYNVIVFIAQKLNDIKSNIIENKI